MNSVVVVGLGGIGSHLVEPLGRYLASRPPPPAMVLVDGDKYAESNRDRQRVTHCDTGMNKAAAQARRLRTLLPHLQVRAIEEFFGERNSSQVLGEGDLAIVCPDNHATRLCVSARCQRLRNAAAVFAGNELSDGAVQVYVRRSGRDVTPRPESFHPEWVNSRERNPADLSCDELAARPGGGQVIVTNVMAASVALNAAFALLEGKVPDYHEVYLDVLKNMATARRR